MMPINPLAQSLDEVLNKTHNLWEELRGQSIFLTGGTGFFGCWLIESFLWANKSLNLNASLTVLTRNKKAFLNKYPYFATDPALQFCEGDICDFSYPSLKFSYLIHAATDTSGQSKPLDLLDSIVLGTRHILEFARQAKMQKVLLISSGAVYGPQTTDLPHPCETQLATLELDKARSAYGIGKCTAEHLSFLYAQQFGLDIKIARCFAFLGPYQPLDGGFAIGNFIADVLAGRPIQVKGDGSPIRSYLYASDLSIWLWTILLKGKASYPYNVGSDVAYSLAEVAHLVSETLGNTAKVQILQAKTSKQAAESYVPNIERAKNELGLCSSVTLERAIELTAAWNAGKEALSD